MGHCPSGPHCVCSPLLEVTHRGDRVVVLTGVARAFGVPSRGPSVGVSTDPTAAFEAAEGLGLQVGL